MPDFSRRLTLGFAIAVALSWVEATKAVGVTLLVRVRSLTRDRRPIAGVAHGGSLFVLSVAALGVVRFYHPAQSAPLAPFAAITRLRADASMNAFGTSREVRLRFALPGTEVEFPLEVSGDVSRLTYEWISTRNTAVVDSARPVNGPSFAVPSKPGFYRLAIIRGGERQLIAEPLLAVMVPFRPRQGGVLNGYRIGTYLVDRFGRQDHPDGFIEVGAGDLDLKVSKHLRLGDFLSKDGQADVWPKYIALSPRLLDKLELVLARVGAAARFRQAHDEPSVAFDVHSGFRTPAHNAGVPLAAQDSRHQYGDAVDLAIDANGDGRVTSADESLVESAVDQIEADFPDLAGGLGLYTSELYRTPYVHIDVRGWRSRWKG